MPCFEVLFLTLTVCGKGVNLGLRDDEQKGGRKDFETGRILDSGTRLGGCGFGELAFVPVDIWIGISIIQHAVGYFRVLGCFFRS